MAAGHEQILQGGEQNSKNLVSFIVVGDTTLLNDFFLHEIITYFNPP